MRILHVLRAPIGGLFRHVCDLVKGQSELGHNVGIICDSTTGGASAEALLAKIEPFCKLGIVRIPVAIKPSFQDFSNIAKTRAIVSKTNADIVHGHGAKGGLYARLAAKKAKLGAIYTPHGGSIHYNWSSLSGRLFLGTELYLRKFTAGFAFVCDFERKLYDKKIGFADIPTNVVHNGLWQDEFKLIPASKSARDLLFVGEMCDRKGVDILIRAIAQLKPETRLTAAMVGDGPELDDYRVLAKSLGVSDQLDFTGRMSIAQALPLGKLFVSPSRLESFPYVILEVIAAGRPIISTDVGGLNEVLPPELMFESHSVAAMAKKLIDAHKNYTQYQLITEKLRKSAPQNFSAEKMVKSITDFYTRLN